MTTIIVNLFNFSIFILIQLHSSCSAINFPITANGDKSHLRQSFRISSNVSRINGANRDQVFSGVNRHGNVNRDRYRELKKSPIILNPKQFGVATRQKFTDKIASLCSPASGRTSKDCGQSDLTILKNREFLEIRRKNPLLSKIPDDSGDQLPLQRAQPGSNDEQLFSHLSSLFRSAADMVNLFQRVAVRERATPQQAERSIQRRHSMPTSKAVRPGRRSLPMKSLAQPRLAETQGKPKALEDTAWAELLFGPRGVLTAVFYILDDRRKITGKTSVSRSITSSNSETTDSYHQSDLSLLPDFLVNAKPIDFAKIFEAFLTGSKGDFDERISNLPEILGICNRLSCGDIYKAIDEFRKSDFFTNFQTALQLIQDPKGWEILGDLISNPELIAQFMNGAGGGSGGLENLFGSIAGAGKASKNQTKEIGPGDGDLGIDFSKMVEGSGTAGPDGGFKKLKKPTPEELPEIAENIDAVDYYNAVESGTDTDGIEMITKPDIVTVTETTVLVPSTSTVATRTALPAARTRILPRATPALPDLSLPEIAENIDENGQTEIIIDATTPPPVGRIWKNKAGLGSTFFHRLTTSLPKQTAVTPPRAQRPYFTVTYRPTTTTTTAASQHRLVGTTRTTITTRYPTRIIVTTTWPTPIPTTRATTKNFREESDYYAMYYDDVRTS